MARAPGDLFSNVRNFVRRALPHGEESSSERADRLLRETDERIRSSGLTEEQIHAKRMSHTSREEMEAFYRESDAMFEQWKEEQKTRGLRHLADPDSEGNPRRSQHGDA